METMTCPICSRARSAAMFVCRQCAEQAKKDLGEISEFVSWADEKRARIGSTWSVGRGSRASETPLPYDPRVSRVIEPIHNDLTTWARIVWDQAPLGIELAGTDTSSVASWLIDYCEWFGKQPEASDAFAAWKRGKDALHRLFDRPPDKVYLGRCNADTEFGPCIESLYMEVSDSPPAQIDCPRCARGVVVADRRAELAEGVENYLGTARELARLLRVVLGEDASPKMLWAYAKHGLIHSHGVRVEWDTLGRRREVPTYRIGDVREAARIIAADEAQRKKFRQTMRGIVAA